MKVRIAIASFAVLARWVHPAETVDIAPFVETQPGALPIVLAAPHGGALKPAALKDRTTGKVAQDSNTAELTLELAAALEKQTGQRPRVILCRLHRMKVDCNRELDEAAQGDPIAEATWRLFHASCRAACEDVARAHGAGLFLDMHGHRHPDPRVELGYLINGTQLRLTDEALNANAEALAGTSVRELVERSRQPLAALVRGPRSLGALLEARGFACVPAPGKPAPLEGADYFSGAFDITAHGSQKSGAISAIQVESPWKGVRDTAAHRSAYAQALAGALIEYFAAHFKMPLDKKAR